MAGFMQATVVGNVGRKEELRFLPSGVPVLNFTVAVNVVTGSGETRKEATTWIRVACWRGLAETMAQHLTVGGQVLIIGNNLQARAYAAKDGTPAASLELTAQEIRFLGAKPTGAAGDAAPEEEAEAEFEF
jgi:single-strand DNA-binding protein